MLLGGVGQKLLSCQRGTDLIFIEPVDRACIYTGWWRWVVHRLDATDIELAELGYMFKNPDELLLIATELFGGQIEASQLGNMGNG